MSLLGRPAAGALARLSHHGPDEACCRPILARRHRRPTSNKAGCRPSLPCSVWPGRVAGPRLAGCSGAFCILQFVYLLCIAFYIIRILYIAGPAE